MNEQKQYLRFSVAQRIEHWVQMLSFFLLGLTGLPQKFAGEGWAETLIKTLGGIENVRIIHHTAAVVMATACIYHVIVVAYKVFVLRVRWTMFPRLDDLLDALDVIRYNLGLTKERPKFDRFSFEEKAEYWAFVWGAIVMGVTGFMMWNPINTARFVPGDLIPAAKAAHGGEALLAVLAIIVWHFYSVHIKMFNKSMFTGKLNEHEMVEEHALELERIKSGKADPRPAPDVIKQRERWFIPVATVLSVAMLVILFLFVTYEQTAITTLPKRATVQVFAPITLTPTPRAGAPTVNVTVKALPASHAGRTTCLVCHQNLPQPKMPADHAGRTDPTCSACHALPGSAASSASSASSVLAGATPAATSPAASGPKPIPASHTGRTTCNVCHETGTAGPKNPADHAGRADATCTACHKPAAASSASNSSAASATTVPTKASAPASSAASTGPKPLPASHAGRTTCNVCHETGVGGAPKNPTDHAGRIDTTCLACHKPQ